MQIFQNKCLRFCLNLNNRAHLGQKEFKQINWLPIDDRFKEIISSMSFKFCNNTSPLFANDVFKAAGQSHTTTRASLLKLNRPLERTNHGQNNISYIAPIICSNLSNSLKPTDNLKACVRYFYQFLFFHQMIALQNLWKMFFIPSEKLSSFSGYSNFCPFSLPFHTFQTQKEVE